MVHGYSRRIKTNLEQSVYTVSGCLTTVPGPHCSMLLPRTGSSLSPSILRKPSFFSCCLTKVIICKHALTLPFFYAFFLNSYRREELLQTLALVDCKALVAVPALKSSNYCEILLDLLPELGHQKPGQLNTEKLPSLRKVILFDNGTTVPEQARMTGVIDYNDVARAPGSLELEDAIHKERGLIVNRDIVNLQFTSGTTGRPK